MKDSSYFELLELVNLTTNISIASPQKGERMEAVEYSDFGISFECQQKSCAQGQLVKIVGLLIIRGNKKEFNCVGKIQSISILLENRAKVSLDFHQFDREIWQEFWKTLRDKQNSVDSLFNKMRSRPEDS
jgi:hypothetical protein